MIVCIEHLQVLVADINIGYEDIVNTQVTESFRIHLHELLRLISVVKQLQSNIIPR